MRDKIHMNVKAAIQPDDIIRALVEAKMLNDDAHSALEARKAIEAAATTYADAHRFAVAVGAWVAQTNKRDAMDAITTRDVIVSLFTRKAAQ